MDKTQLEALDRFGKEWKEAALPQTKLGLERLRREGIFMGDLTPKERAIFKIAFNMGWSESASYVQNRATVLPQSEVTRATKTFASSLKASATMSSIGMFLIRIFGR